MVTASEIVHIDRSEHPRMPDQLITVRATDQTPPELRHLDGRTYPVRSILPASVGEHGTLHGIPGVMREGLVWEITSDRPPPRDPGPGWAQEIAALLTEIRDLLRR